MASQETQSDLSVEDPQDVRDHPRDEGVRRVSRKVIGAIAVVFFATIIAALAFFTNSSPFILAVGESTLPPTEELPESDRAEDQGSSFL